MWQDYIENFGWSRLGFSLQRPPHVVEDQDTWKFQLELLPPGPQDKPFLKRNKQAKNNEQQISLRNVDISAKLKHWCLYDRLRQRIISCTFARIFFAHPLTKT